MNQITHEQLKILKESNPNYSVDIIADMTDQVITGYFTKEGKLFAKKVGMERYDEVSSNYKSYYYKVG